MNAFVASGLKLLGEMAISSSVSTIVEDFAIPRTPRKLGALGSFGYRSGTDLLGGLIGSVVSYIIIKNVSEIIATVRSVETETVEEDEDGAGVDEIETDPVLGEPDAPVAKDPTGPITVSVPVKKPRTPAPKKAKDAQ